MLRTFIVVDDFLDYPDQIRKHALKVDYEDYGDTYFPGRNSKQPATIANLDKIIGDIVKENLTPAEGTSHAKFRIALEGDKGKGGVHIDKCQWSGILFLSPDGICNEGTHFYRHRELDTEKAPLNKDELTSLGLNSFEQLWNDYLLKDSTDPSKWERTMTIPMKYNRLILFRPWLFHNAGKSFGTSLENGRLIYPLFYNQVV